MVNIVSLEVTLGVVGQAWNELHGGSHGGRDEESGERPGRQQWRQGQKWREEANIVGGK